MYLKEIFNNYNTSSSIEETLYLLVKIYQLIDEIELAKNYASILAYNFPDSKWYKLSFNLINDIDEELKKEFNLDIVIEIISGMKKANMLDNESKNKLSEIIHSPI